MVKEGTIDNSQYTREVLKFLPPGYKVRMSYVPHLQRTIVCITRGALEVKYAVKSINDMAEAKSLALAAKDAIEEERISYVSDSFGYPANSEEES